MKTQDLRTLCAVSLISSLGLAAPVAAQQASTTPALESPAAAADWSAATWRAQLASAVAAARSSHPSAEARLHKLQGLDPAVYLKRKRPEPDAGRELADLVRKGEVPAVLVAQLLLEGLDGYVHSAADAFTGRFAKQAETLRAMERTQLRDGLMMALGASAHPVAPHALLTFLAPSQPEGARIIAAIALGKTRSEHARAPLEATAAGPKTTSALRHASFVGLASFRDGRALDQLLPHLGSGELATRSAAVAAVGNAASSWGLRGREDSAALRERAGRALAEQLRTVDDSKLVAQLIRAIGMVAHPAASETLLQIARDESLPSVRRERAERAHKRSERAIARALR
jgi:hypothetical protein